jgi:hypothetical protein
VNVTRKEIGWDVDDFSKTFVCLEWEDPPIMKKQEKYV